MTQFFRSVLLVLTGALILFGSGPGALAQEEGPVDKLITQLVDDNDELAKTQKRTAMSRRSNSGPTFHWWVTQ